MLRTEVRWGRALLTPELALLTTRRSRPAARRRTSAQAAKSGKAGKHSQASGLAPDCQAANRFSKGRRVKPVRRYDFHAFTIECQHPNSRTPAPNTSGSRRSARRRTPVRSATLGCRQRVRPTAWHGVVVGSSMPAVLSRARLGACCRCWTCLRNASLCLTCCYVCSNVPGWWESGLRQACRQLSRQVFSVGRRQREGKREEECL